MEARVWEMKWESPWGHRHFINPAGANGKGPERGQWEEEEDSRAIHSIPSPRLAHCLFVYLPPSLSLSPRSAPRIRLPPPPPSIANSSPQSCCSSRPQQQFSGAMAAAMATVAANMGAMTAFGAATPVKSRFLAGSSSVSALGCSNGSRVSMAEWLPGNPRPAYLDGSAPGSVHWVSWLACFRGWVGWLLPLVVCVCGGWSWIWRAFRCREWVTLCAHLVISRRLGHGMHFLVSNLLISWWLYFF